MPTLACEPFATKDELYETVCDGLTSPTDDALVELALADATDTLVKVSGYRYYGVCTHTIRPCRECSTGDWCGCCYLDTVPLPDDVVSVTQVKIDGAVIAPSTYAIKWGPMGAGLVRVATGDRPDRWPACQKLWRPDTEIDTFSITITTGQAVSLVERMAAIELAISFIRSSPGRSLLAINGADRVSGGGVQISRDEAVQGITDNIDDLPSVGNFRAKWNPFGSPVFSAGWSPELEEGWAS